VGSRPLISSAILPVRTRPGTYTTEQTRLLSQHTPPAAKTQILWDFTTDGHKAYAEAVAGTFGKEVDYATEAGIAGHVWSIRSL
jgi:hypothetical protein